MNIIDDKGRFLGIINIIDLISIIFLLFLTLGFFQLYQKEDLFRDFNPQKKEYIQKEVLLLIKNQNLKDILEIKFIKESQNFSENFRITDIDYVKSSQIPYPQNNEFYDIQITTQLYTHFDHCTQQYYYNNYQLLKNVQIILKYNEKEITGEILEIK